MDPSHTTIFCFLENKIVLFSLWLYCYNGIRVLCLHMSLHHHSASMKFKFCAGLLAVLVLPASHWTASAQTVRDLPKAGNRPLSKEASAVFVDPSKGDDGNSGTLESPWKNLGSALRRLKPGDTLVLRGGRYYERVVLTQSGEPGKKITIRSYPGELAVIDGGLREFYENPATAWVPAESGALGEFVSAKAYPEFDGREIVQHFLPAEWEAFFGIEEKRPLAFGLFADSLIPLHGYRTLHDLQSSNELGIGKTDLMSPVEDDQAYNPKTGFYTGPGVWYNRRSGRIHIRLAHTNVEGLGDRNYGGETDPRKLPLHISCGYGRDVLRINHVRDVSLQDLAIMGGSGSALIDVYGAESLEFDGLFIFGGSPSLLGNATRKFRVVNCVFRGLAAPWISRASMKYLGTPAYLVITQSRKPLNEEWEFGFNEFTDGHDFFFMRHIKGLDFHHNLVDNFNDDGLELGTKSYEHRIAIRENRISRCHLTLSAHEQDKDDNPLESAEGSGVYIFRNVFDLREATYGDPPKEPGVPAKFRNSELCGDHGSPRFPDIRFYHNTVILDGTQKRLSYGFNIGKIGLGQRDFPVERRVFNNIFVQMHKLPVITFPFKIFPVNLQAGGNLFWSVAEGSGFQGNIFETFRSSQEFEKSKEVYPPGWTTGDSFANPGLDLSSTESSGPSRLVPAKDSPAFRMGVSLPEEWPDPLRVKAGNPGAGAIPEGSAAWGVGAWGATPVSR